MNKLERKIPPWREHVKRGAWSLKNVEYRTSFGGESNRKSLWKGDNGQSAISAAEITSTVKSFVDNHSQRKQTLVARAVQLLHVAFLLSRREWINCLAAAENEEQLASIPILLFIHVYRTRVTWTLRYVSSSSLVRAFAHFLFTLFQFTSSETRSNCNLEFVKHICLFYLTTIETDRRMLPFQTYFTYFCISINSPLYVSTLLSFAAIYLSRFYFFLFL